MLLAFAPLWLLFCSILALESFLLLFLIEKDKPGWCTLSMLSSFGLLKVLAGINVFTLAWHHPIWALLSILGYFAAGTGWAIGKWYLYVTNQREKYNTTKTNWLPRQFFSSKGELSAPKETWETSYERKKFLNSRGGLVPLVRDNKSRVFTWLGYWPWSMLWTAIDDPVRKALNAIYNGIHNTLQSISNNAFKGVE